MNRILFFLSISFFLLSLNSCSYLGRTPSSESNEDKVVYRHVVFDIDWTITSEVENPKLPHPRMISVEGKFYYVHEGVEELVMEILKMKNVRISFFSGGKLSRNNELLSKIKLSDGNSLKDIAYKIKGFEDLVAVPNIPETEKFYKRFKKDLTLISQDLTQLIMIDDTEHFVLGEYQEKHVLFLGTAIKYFNDYNEAQNQIGPYIPSSKSSFHFHKNKINILRGSFQEADKEFSRGGRTWTEILKSEERLLNLTSQDFNQYSSKILNNLNNPPRQIINDFNQCNLLFTAFAKLP